MQVEGFSSVAFSDVEPGKLFAFNKGKLTWGMRCFAQSDERRFLLALNSKVHIDNRTSDSFDVGVVEGARLAFSADDMVYCGPPPTSLRNPGQLLVQGPKVYILAMIFEERVWVDCGSGEIMQRGAPAEPMIIVNKWKIVDKHWPYLPPLLEHEIPTSQSLQK